MNLIHNRDCDPLDKLVTIVAYYEACESPISNTCASVVYNHFVAAYDTDEHPKSRAQPHIEFSQDIFDDAKQCLSAILAKHRHRDGPRVVALLRPLTKHQILRERILTQDVLVTLVNLLDWVVQHPAGIFGQAMDSLNSLLQRGALVNIVHLGNSPMIL